jgi:hypothetical protein
MITWADQSGLILRIIAAGGDQSGDYELADVRIEAGPDKQHMTYRSGVCSWGHWVFHLEKTLGLDPQVVDQVRKRLQVDRDGHVDIQLDEPVFVHQLGLEPIEPTR